MNISIDTETRLRLQKLAFEMDRTVEDLAECAVAEAALDSFRGRTDDPAKLGRAALSAGEAGGEANG